MPRQKRQRRRKGLKKVTVRTSRFEQDLQMLKKANKLVTGMSSNARRWLKANLG